MIKNLDDYRDERGFIGHKRPDGRLEFGDGSNRLGLYWLAKATVYGVEVFYHHHARGFAKNYFSLWQADPNEPVRHPDSSEFYGQVNTMSRDNFLPIVGCLAATDQLYGKTELLKIRTLLKGRKGFLWNTEGIWETTGFKIPDWAGYAIYRLIFGSIGPKWLRYPLDFLACLDSLLRVLSAYLFPSHTSADVTFFAALMARRLSFPTFFSELSAWLYFRFRPGGPESAFKSYFANPEAPPLDIVLIDAAKVIRKELGL